MAQTVMMVQKTPMPRHRLLPALAALNGALAIAFGAFAAHGIGDLQAKAWLNTALSIQLPHAAAVFALLGWRNTPGIRAGCWALALGAAIFAASLDLLALGAGRSIAALAPLGGVMLIGGWLWIMVVALRDRDQ
jgi:uncharacterized membrane protein YgdD (TMEM256/DUF423 family)